MPQTKEVVFCLIFVTMTFASFCLIPVYHSGLHWMLSLKVSKGQIGLEISELEKVSIRRTQMWSGARATLKGNTAWWLMRKDRNSGPLPERLRLRGIRTGFLLRVSPTKDKPLPLGATCDSKVTDTAAFITEYTT